MSEETEDNEEKELSEEGKIAKFSRGALQAIGGAVPFAGGVFSAIAGAWSEGEQDKVNRFFDHWVRMLQDELKEKEETIIEIMARLDLQDEAISERVERGLVQFNWEVLYCKISILPYIAVGVYFK